MFSYTEILPSASHFDWFIFSAFAFIGALIALLISILITVLLEVLINVTTNVLVMMFAVLMVGVLFVSVRIADTPAKVYENIKYPATFDHLESVRSGKSGYATKIVYRLENGNTVMMPYADGQVINKTTVLYYNK